jgi:hypothetical protein
VHEVPLPERTLLPLDDQQRFAFEDEEILLVVLPVVHRHRLARLEQRQVDPELDEIRSALETRALELAQDPAAAALPPVCLARVDDEPALPFRDKPVLGRDELRLGNHGREDATSAGSRAERHSIRLILRRVGKPPTSPYPPDLAEDAPPVVELADLVDVAVQDVDWANRQVPRLVARRVELDRCRLTGTELAEATLADVTVTDCRLDLVGLRMAKLERVVFRRCRMTECDFYDASLTDVLFDECDLTEATFTDARLTRVELRASRLTGLRGVEALRGARLPWSDALENAPLFATALGLELID